MTYEDKILDFLAKAENLPIAFQIADYVQKLKETTQLQFWAMFSDAIVEKLNDLGYSDSWKFVPPPEERWDKSWETCAIQPIDGLSSSQPFLQIAIQQGTPNNDFRLLMGVYWLPESPKDFMNEQFSTLKIELVGLGRTQSNEKWPGWNWLPFRLRGESFITKMHNEPQLLIEELSNIYLDFFQNIALYVQSVNESIEEDIPKL